MQTHFSVDANNAKLSSWWGFWSSGDGINLNYNGVEVLYFPKSFLEKGFTTGTLSGYRYPESGGYQYSLGNVLWFGNRNFLNQTTWDYLKPAKLEQNLIDVIGSRTADSTKNTYYWSTTGQTYQQAFDMRNVPNFADGYIIEKTKYDEITKQTTNGGTDPRMYAYSPYRIPSGMGTAPDGNLSYVGYTSGGANDRRSDLFYINNSSSAQNGRNQFSWQDCGIFGCGFSDFLGSTLGQLIVLGARIYSPWFNLGYTVGNAAFNDGKLTDVALAVVSLNMPTGTEGVSAAKGTIFEIPQIASMTSDLAKFYEVQLGLESGSKVAAAAAMTTVNTGLNYLGNGQDFKKAFTTAAAQYVGGVAAETVASQLVQYGPTAQKIISETTKAVTRAALLNQDVQQAGLSAFVQTAIPLALDGALEKAGLTLSANVKRTINEAAINAALLPNANVDEILRSAAIGGVVRAITDKTTEQAVKEKVITSNNQNAINKIAAYVGQYFTGRTVDDIVNTSIVNDALKAADLDVKNYMATGNGWDNWNQWQEAKRFYGNDVTKEFYEERVVSPEKIINILKQEGVPESDWQNIIDFYEGMVGKESTAAQVLADVRNFVNPLYMTGAEREYVETAFSKLEEFDKEKYKEQYDLALDNAKKGNFANVEAIANWVNQNYTSTNEAISLWKEAFKFVGEDNYQPTEEQINLIKGKNQISAYTIAQHIAGERAVTFDATKFTNPKEAEEAARAAKFNNFAFNDGFIYKVTTPVTEASIRDEISRQATFGEAFRMARDKFGPGKTFAWNNKQFTTNVLPDGVFDASRSSDVTQSAILAYANNRTSFLASDGKIYTIPESAKSQLDAAVNTTPAEAKRLLEKSISIYPDQTLNEVARLMETSGKGKMDFLSASTSLALGTSFSGLAQFIEEASKSYALFTKDFDFNNVGVKLASELEEIASGQMPFGFDVQKYRFEVALNAVANEKDPIKQSKMFAEAVNNNKMAFLAMAGSETVAEIPYIAAFIGASLALAPMGATAVLVGGGLITAASTIMEVTGTAAESAINASRAQGDSEQVARDKGLMNAASAWLIETGTDFMANRFLLGSIGTDGVKSVIKAFGVGASNTAVGGATNFVQGFSQSLAEQLIVNPDTASFNKAYADGLLEFAIGGTSQGALSIAGYALMPNTVIGKDYSGNNVTLNDVLIHDKVVDSSTINPNVVVGRSGNNNSFTLGGMITNMPTYNFNGELQQTYLPQIYNNPNMTVGFDALGNNVTYGQVLAKTNNQVNYQQAFNEMVNPSFDQKNQIQKDFLTNQFKDIGFNPTESTINSLIVDNPGGNQALINSAKTVAFTEIAVEENYRLSDSVLNSILSPTSNIKTADEFRRYIDPMATTVDEAREYLTQRNIEPTDDLIRQLTQAGNFIPTEEDANRALQVATNRLPFDPKYDWNGDGRVTSADALNLSLVAKGREPNTPMAPGLPWGSPTSLTEEQALKKAEELDAQFVSRQEVLKAYEDLGLKQPTEADIEKLIGQYDQSELVSRAQENLETARINSILERLDNLSVGANQETLNAINAVRLDLAGQLELLGQDVGSPAMQDDPNTPDIDETRPATGIYAQIQAQSAETQKTILDKIKEYEDAGIERNEALDKAINDVSRNLGISTELLSKQIGTPAILDDPNTPDIDESKPSTGLYSELDQRFEASQKLLAETEQSIFDKMQEYEKAGISRDEALNRAINDVSTELGITKTELSTQIGKPAIQDDPNTEIDESRPASGIFQRIDESDAERDRQMEALKLQMEEYDLARRIEAQERATAAQRLQLLDQGSKLTQEGVSGILPFLGAAAVAADDGAKFKDPFITSKVGQEEFKGSLEEFQKEVAQSDYTKPKFGQNQEFMGGTENMQQGETMPNYFTYGKQSDIDQMFNPFGPIATSFNPFPPMLAARGGLAVLMANGGSPAYADGGLPIVAHSGKNRIDFRSGAAVSGPGDGQSDDIPAMLADGEFVFPADVVAALGNGSTKAGSEKLYNMMHSIRSHHRSAKPEDLPPPAKASPLDYLKMRR